MGSSLWFNTKPFYQAVQDFYVAASLNKMLKKFPFGDTILKDLASWTLIWSALFRHLQSVEFADSASIQQWRMLSWLQFLVKNFSLSAEKQFLQIKNKIHLLH